MKYVFVLFVLAMMLMGCGGAGGGRFHGETPFTGQWTGTWQRQDGTQAGTTQYTVDNKADLLGTLLHPELGLGAIDGWCDTDGEIQGTIRYPGDIEYSFHGDMFLNAPNEIVGNIWVERTGEPDTLYTINTSRT